MPPTPTPTTPDSTSPETPAEGLPETPAEGLPPVAEEAPRPPAWRTVALVKKSRTVSFSSGAVKLLGGELVTEPDRVASLRGDDAFQFIEVESRDHLAWLQEGLVRRQTQIREAAAELGLVVFRDGEVTPPRARG